MKCSLHNFARIQSWLERVAFVTQCLTWMKKKPALENMPINFKPNTQQRRQTGNSR